MNGRVLGLVAPVTGSEATNKDYVDGIETALQNDILLRVPTSDKGASNGVATLDGGGVIPISQIPSSIQGGIKVIGSWDANTNTPDLSALTLDQGEAYIVSVAGSTNLNGETNWKVKDLAVWSDSLAGNYYKLDNTDDVLSVSGKTGVVVVVAGDIADFQSSVSANSDLLQNASDITDLQNTRLQSVVAGEGVSVDATDPLNPIVSIFTPKIARSDTISTNTTTTPLSKLSETFANVPAGDYEIVFTASHSYDDIGSDLVIECEIDGVSQGTSDEAFRLEPKDSGGTDGDGRGTNQKAIFTQTYPHTQASLGSVDTEVLFFSSAGGEISALWGVSIELKAVTNV